MGITVAFLIAQIILLISYLMTSMFLLRALVCVAQIGIIIATLLSGLHQPGMLSTFIFSILVFLINIIYIYRLLYVKIPATIPEKYKSVYQDEFPQFSPREFIILMKYSELGSITDDYLIKENTIADVFLIFDGEAWVLMGSTRITELKPHRIIGEISFLTQSTSIACVKATNTVNFCTWTREKLLKLKNKYPSVYYKFYDFLLRCAAAKLRKQNIKPLPKQDVSI